MYNLSSRGTREKKLAENLFEAIVIENFAKFAEKHKFTDSRISVIPKQGKYENNHT